MQGQRSTIGSLPESLGFDHGSSSSETGIDQQIFWNNNMLIPAQNRLSGYISPSDTSNIYLNPTSQEEQNLSVWSTGEPSSSASQIQVSHGDQKTENGGWSSLMKNGAGAGPSFETQRYEPASTLSLDDVNINVNRNQIANGHGPLFLQSSSISDSVSHDVNMNSSFGCHDVMDSGVIECHNAFGSRSSENLQGTTASGEPSSSASQIQVGHGDQKTENGGWSSLMKNGVGAGPSLETQRYEPASTLSLDDVNINVNRNQIANGHGPLFLQSSSISDSVSHDVNMNSSFGCHDVMDSGVIECHNAFGSRSSENLQGTTASSSSDPFGLPSGATGGYLEGQTDGRSGRSLDGRRLPCKRKALELSMGQSSESESSNFFQHPEGSVWHAVPARRNVNSSLTISTSSEDILGARSSEQIIPRLGLGVGGIASENRHASTAAGSAETTQRNIRLRNNASRQESLPISSFMPISNSVGQSSSYPPSIVLPTNNPVELRSPVLVENSSSQGQPVIRVPALRRNLQVSRWSRSSSSRPSHAAHVVSGERDIPSLAESRTALRNVSEHPIFMPATAIRVPAQNAVNWSLTGGNVSNAGNVASSSRSSSISGVHPLVAHRNYPHYPRRLSEFVRRSLMSADSDMGGQVNNNVFPPPSGTSASSQEAAPPSLPGGQGHHLSHSRSAMMLDSQLDGAAFALPYLSRSLASASEGRNRLVSEIRNVLDLMRRGDGLRFEDVMILDQSVFYGMPDIHDRHRDMRLDIDNMSYEELLALEERIGNVNTGLNEETILKRLKQQKFAAKAGQVETEPCCICQEEYNDGDDLGGLECGHNFHTTCIKQWLLQKNLCPICKSTAFAP